ncbi:ChrR family anti-sigma-E factor [Azorhizobium doebereinerae]|uniref:ChrR family anti-sigma-E factor n=1 Tax=Azorhizobium doebereinerae TaxID=281091 RepID=UPI00048C0A79|nr:ChrR family anti-sigma-E factor [Azorhizobium doebereinerae]
MQQQARTAGETAPRRHHPSEETLLAYAAGSLAAGPAVVTESHLALCAPCRARLAAFRAAGGAILDALPPTPLAGEALEHCAALAALPAPARPARRLPRRQPRDIVLPASLKAYEFGRWMWLGPGVRSCRIIVPAQPRATARLLRIAPGCKIPEHGHSGAEFTLVLHGSFCDGHDRFLPGDFSEADGEVDHQPISDPGVDCICVTALEGRMRFHGLLGRLTAPFGGL